MSRDIHIGTETVSRMRKVAKSRKRRKRNLSARARASIKKLRAELGGENASSAAYLEVHETFVRKKKNMTDAGINENDSESNLVSNEVKEHEGYLYVQAAIKAGKNLYFKEYNRMVPIGLNFEDWIDKHFPRYFMTPLGGVGYKEITLPKGIGTTTEEIRFEFRAARRNGSFKISGQRDAVLKFVEWMTSEGFDDSEVSIQWAFGKDYRDMDIYDLPLDIPHKIESAYPWLGKTIAEYSKAFMESKASILILIGPPGTGKTTFIKELIKESDISARVTYDTDLLFSDGFFASFMTDEDLGMLILEDADTVMGSRKEGNTMMHKFLNASDGLVSLPRKKIIFTTNLPSVNEVDPALMRRGRCFDVLHFRELSLEEAGAVVKEIKGVMPATAKKSYSLAEIVNSIDNGAAKVRNPIGFS